MQGANLRDDSKTQKWGIRKKESQQRACRWAGYCHRQLGLITAGAHYCWGPSEELCKTCFRRVPLLGRRLGCISTMPIFHWSRVAPGTINFSVLPWWAFVALGEQPWFWKSPEQKNREAWQVLGLAVYAQSRALVYNRFQLPLLHVTGNFLSRAYVKGKGSFYFIMIIF